jgi:hypothetical protein
MEEMHDPSEIEREETNFRAVEAGQPLDPLA